MANGAGLLGQIGLFSQGGEVEDTESEPEAENDEDDVLLFFLFFSPFFFDPHTHISP